MRSFRLFVSSPGDAVVERRRTENAVSRLNGEFAGLARLETIRWESEYYSAHATFQAQIPAAADCDIVVGILKWKLGTELPPGFEERLATGEPYPSGTAYELLTAIEKRKASKDLPDVFVFKFAGSAPSIVIDDPERLRIERDWAALCGFFERWFVNQQGHFLAAFNSYDDEDQFEHDLETLLRKWLAEKVAGGRVVPWPTVKGSPFRALSVFGAKHAPVFFGRAGDTRRATDLWRAAAAKGAGFLLIVGASGSGKSSLARAGLIPRLTTPGVVAAVDRWRVAVMRPGDVTDGPFTALATALLSNEDTLPDEEKGRGAALPEIAEGDSKTPADLAAVLAHADASAIKPVLNALARIEARVKDSEHHGRSPRCDLVLLVDQLDELFADAVPRETRERFADLLAALVASGRVWLIATLRDDLYAPMLLIPALKQLKDDGASYDLVPPGEAELAEIVRAPAEAAGLTYETGKTTGERLDERLLREADEPDMLPLVQLALSHLWEARETIGNETVLTVAAFEKLGGVKGIIAEAGDTVMRGLGAAEAECLAPLIRQLAEVSRGASAIKGTMTARAAPFEDVASSPEAAKLIQALVAARLLTLAGERGAIRVRLAHQRVLSDWPRAQEIASKSIDFYRVRDAVDMQRRRWDDGKRRGELLLSRGLPLAEARAMLGTYGPELSKETRTYIEASRQRANRGLFALGGAAVLFAALAFGALVESRRADAQRALAEEQKTLADRNFAAAKGAINGLIFDIAQGLEDVAGMRVETIRTILETTRKTVERLQAVAPEDRDLRRSRLVMLLKFSETYLKAGDLGQALKAGLESLDIARKIAAQDPGNAQAQSDVSASLINIGEIKRQAGDQAGALAAYQEGLDIRRKIAARDPGNAQAQRDVAASLDRIGNIRLQAGDQAGAFAAYQESLDIARKIAARDPGNAQAQRDVSVSLIKIGDIKLQAEDQARALAAYQESLDIRRKIAAQDPGNAQAQRDVFVSLIKIGDIKRQAGDQAGAFAAYQESLDIARKIAAQDPGNAQAQRDLSASLDNIGDIRLLAGDRAAALAAYQESLDIRRKIAALDPENAQAQRDVSVSLLNIGDIRLQAGDQAGALTASQESLDIARKIAVLDSANVDAQWDLIISLDRVGGMTRDAAPYYREALAICLRLDRAGLLAPARKFAIDYLNKKL